LFGHDSQCPELQFVPSIRDDLLCFVFSSTAALYGTPEKTPILETAPLQPTNAYGASKLLVEQMLEWFHRIHGLRYASLRYFNVAGSATDGSLGEDHEPETHLIPVLLNTALGKRPSATIFGEDYATEDGTCIRDYIHVQDLVDAHAAVMDALEPGQARFYNLGIGKGYSVKQVVEAVKKVTGVDLNIEIGPLNAEQFSAFSRGHETVQVLAVCDNGKCRATSRQDQKDPEKDPFISGLCARSAHSNVLVHTPNILSFYTLSHRCKES